MDSVLINMDQLTFCPLMYTPFVLQIWFFGDFVWFHWSYQPNVLQFYCVSQTFEAFAVSFCIKIWIILSCNSRGLIDLVAEYLNHHASPGEKRSALNYLYMLWSIFLKKTVIPVKPFGCKRLWPTHCWALQQSALYYLLCKSYCSPSKQIIIRPPYACSWRYFSPIQIN